MDEFMVELAKEINAPSKEFRVEFRDPQPENPSLSTAIQQTPLDLKEFKKNLMKLQDLIARNTCEIPECSSEDLSELRKQLKDYLELKGELNSNLNAIETIRIKQEFNRKRALEMERELNMLKEKFHLLTSKKIEIGFE
jgi:predicted RNase H-like nuclease (RuvC/YqgF family)